MESQARPVAGSRIRPASEVTGRRLGCLWWSSTPRIGSVSEGFDGTVEPLGQELPFGAAEHVELRRSRAEGNC